MKKRILNLALLGALLVCLLAVSAFAADIKLTVDSKPVTWTDAVPYISGGRTMVPLRAAAEAIGLEVDWDGTTKTASFRRDNLRISFTAGHNTYFVEDGTGGAEFEMDCALEIKNGRSYAPIRYLAQNFGYGVGWDGATKTVKLADMRDFSFSYGWLTVGEPLDNKLLVGIGNYQGFADMKIKGIFKNYAPVAFGTEMSQAELTALKEYIPDPKVLVTVDVPEGFAVIDPYLGPLSFSVDMEISTADGCVLPHTEVIRMGSDFEETPGI